MEEALIQNISLLLIVAISHSSPPSFQTAGAVTQLQQLNMLRRERSHPPGLISPALRKLHCPARSSITRILSEVSPTQHPRSLSCPRQPPAVDKDIYSSRGQRDNPAKGTAA